MSRHPIGYIGTASGIILIIAALFASSYRKSEYYGIYPFGITRTTYPYQDYAFPLVIIGILSFVIGAVGLTQKRYMPVEDKTDSIRFYCSKCGEPNSMNSEYCWKCGSKLRGRGQ